MSKLAAIKAQIDDLYDRMRRGRPVMTPIHPSDLEWLCQQAERAEELENEKEEIEDELSDLEESAHQTQIDFLEANGERNLLLLKDQRYKQALEDARGYLLKASSAYTDNCDFHVNYRIQEAMVSIDEALKEDA